MSLFPSGVVSLWRRTIRLAAPATGQFAASSLMRTTDVLITASITPAAVVALGLSDLLVSLATRVGNGYVVGANTLASQDTGTESDALRDQSVTQASLLTVAVAVPFVGTYLLIPEQLFGLIGAGDRATELGVQYIRVVALTIPLITLRKVAGNALRAIGDAKTPMYVTVPMDALNVGLSLVLGLGWFGGPKYGILGVGVATAVASALGTVALCGYLSVRSPIQYTVPRNTTVTVQLTRIAAPIAATGFVTSFAVLPFNTLLLSVGTAVNAGYQLAWRVYSQVVGSVSRGMGVAARTVVGQEIGSSTVAKHEQPLSVSQTTAFITLLTIVVAGLSGVGTVVTAETLVTLLAESQSAAEAAAPFLSVLGGLSVLFVTNNVLTSVLEGGSETRIPLVSRLVGTYGGMVGVSWLGLQFNSGVESFYLGLGACYAAMLAVTIFGLVRTDWIGRATKMIDERDTTTSD